MTAQFAQKPAAIRASAGSGFIETPAISQLIRRAMIYLRAGIPVHLQGPTGCGKTTLALHISELLGRPAMLMYGDDEFGTSDLVGADTGFQRRKTVDNYIHSVLKVEETVNYNWMDNRLTVAISEGYTLIYDEFTRSRPEANNALLSVLAEGVLAMPARQGRRSYIKVHPDFRAIFTSNPIEYVGTHRTQDALTDRMITIHVKGMDAETEAAITAARSGLPVQSAAELVHVIQRLRESGITDTPVSVRASVMMARVMAATGAQPLAEDEIFMQACVDILRLNTPDQQMQFLELMQS